MTAEHEQDDERRGDGGTPETAIEEVLHEVEQAEKRIRDSDEQRRHRGEAGDAITTNVRAEEESGGD
ncbi:hypothetical protein GCM10010129_04150 [Streptomyces fumigatiscleroticus]|nr:hypothetical protein GCM10010129_04150 [Streptomyces fumigatiscleroticus]